MNAKKADWINEPAIKERTLHSLTVESDGEHTVLFTIGEKDIIRLLCRTKTDYAFIVLHTPEEYIAVAENTLISTFGRTRTEIPIRRPENMIFQKDGKRIELLSDENTLLLAVEKDAFLTSVSFGITLKGKGEAYIEVF